MGRFEDLVDSMENPGENGIPDSIYDDLRQAHGDVVAEHTSLNEGSSAKIQELEGRISQLKTQNYDLLMSSKSEPTTGGENGDGSNGDGENGDGEDDGDGKGVDDLFG